MARLKLDQESWGLSSLLEKETSVPVKDCFQDAQTLYVVVPAGWLGKALGKGGSNIHRLQEQLHRKIRMIEYNDDPAQFVRNVISPLTVSEVSVEGQTLLIRDTKISTKSMVIGRDGKNLKKLNRAVQRFFNLEVKVE